MATHLVAPKGMFRVIGVDLFDHTDYIVGDFDDVEIALAKADAHNKQRPGPMADIRYVYDDQGKLLNDMNTAYIKVSP